MCCDLFKLSLTDDEVLDAAEDDDALFSKKYRERGDLPRDISRCRRVYQEKKIPYTEMPEAEGSESTDKPAISNVRAAREFAREYSGLQKFNHSTKGWMTFNGVVWVQDQKGETLDRIAKFCYARGKGDNRFSKDTEQLARNLPEFAVTADMFDRDDMLLATPAGYVDLKAGAMAPPDPQKLVSRCTAVAPSKDEPTRFLQFLEEITGLEDLTVETWDAWHEASDLICFLHRFFGYCILRRHARTGLRVHVRPAGLG